MKSMAKRNWIVVLLVVLTLLPCRASAFDARRPLPAFEVKTLDGRTIQSSEMTPPGKWLLVYVEPGCQPCEEVFKVFNRDAPLADLRQKVIVVVGGRSVEEVTALAARFSWIPAECWHADPLRRAAPALRSEGAPVLYGVRRNHIEWSLKGVLSDPKKLESILLTWCEE